MSSVHDLLINRHKEIEYEVTEYDPSLVILDRLEALGAEIQQALHELRALLNEPQYADT